MRQKLIPILIFSFLLFNSQLSFGQANHDSINKYLGTWSFKSKKDTFKLSLFSVNMRLGKNDDTGLPLIIGDYRYVKAGREVVDTRKQEKKTFWIMTRLNDSLKVLDVQIFDVLKDKMAVGSIKLLTNNSARLELKAPAGEPPFIYSIPTNITLFQEDK